CARHEIGGPTLDLW
nr:immunoglobulin heavy chain junction region [Macaca mulatta]MOX93463.1 immunoglobulin heavy chain junction region [Macaca mulatta]MOX93893.1 immunoglobulin heavy chain junction region [Macaca mulatta]MOX95136.1 immunoglobulin heavy chain junction region [Macaca mulatta]MOX95174.1 immunoglobulin heavy chain junction region [Macaca mulatta]